MIPLVVLLSSFFQKTNKPDQKALHFPRATFFAEVVKKFGKYIDYVFDIRSFSPHFNGNHSPVSEHALQTAQIIRGSERAPAIIMHGIMPRSGTVYVGNLLRLHPDLYSSYPNELWEVPFLQLSHNIVEVQKRFLSAYEPNEGKLGENDFLLLFGSSFIAYLYSFVPQQQRMLVKVPSVQYLHYFFTAFPFEHLLVLVRDGRDVVNSTLKTWPRLGFSNACRRWNRSAKMVLKFHAYYASKENYWLVRFEDVMREPASFVKEACKRVGLNEKRFPYEKIDTIPVRGSSALRSQEKVSWDAMQKPKDFNPVGRWQQWPTRKKRIFKRIAGQSLLDLGYCENLDW